MYQFIYQENPTFSGDYMILKKSYPKKKVFFGISGIFFFILILLSFKPDLFFSFTSKSENNIISQLVLNNPMYQENVDQLIDFRVDEFKSSSLQSLFFTILIFISILALQYRKISQTIFVVIISIVVTVDLWTTSKDYLNNENHSSYEQQMGLRGKKFWQDEELKKFPHNPTPADIAIRDLEMIENPSLTAKIQT